MIEIKNLTLQRGLKVLLDKANATVNPGQRVGLIGKNGTGKSSLFALIKGEITQDGGVIVEQGSPKELFEHPKHERTRKFLQQIRKDSADYRH